MALSSSSIRVAVLEEEAEHVLMEGKFTHKVNTESSLWSLEPGKCVLVSVGVGAPGGGGGHTRREAYPPAAGAWIPAVLGTAQGAPLLALAPWGPTSWFSEAERIPT